MFRRCTEENQWHILICYKDGSIPSIAEEYGNLVKAGAAEGLDREIARECPRKGRVQEKSHMEWVSEIDCRGFKLTLLALKIEIETVKTEKKESKSFQWLTDLKVTGKNANSVNYNTMKCRYLLTQIADSLLQLYEYGSPGLRAIKKSIEKISSDLLRNFGKRMTEEDILFIETYGYVKAAA